MSNVLQLPSLPAAGPAQANPSELRRIQVASDAFETWAADYCLGPPDSADVAMFMIQVMQRSAEQFTYEQLQQALRERRSAA